MNILFYLVPKSDVVYIYDDYTIARTMEAMKPSRFMSVPILNRKGKYVGSITEGDLLWGLEELRESGRPSPETVPVRQLKRNRHNEAVNINCDMEDLIPTAMRQNYIPVTDDDGTFIGIVTRKSIMTYCAELSGFTAPGSETEKEQ